MALLKVNTGTREQEVCSLRWMDEIQVPELNTSVFIIEADKVKNEQDRLIVLNRVERSVIDRVRGQHQEFVFVPTSMPARDERRQCGEIRADEADERHCVEEWS